MKTIKDIVYDEKLKNAGKLDLYLPETDLPCPVLIYIHGGGIEGGDKYGGESLSLQKLTEKNIAFASLNYRMYPDAKFPEFIEDCAKACAFILDKSFTYGKFSKCFIGGSSAGSYISMMLCFDKSYLAAYGINSQMIDGYVFDAGQPTVHFNVLRERDEDPSLIRIDKAAPLYFINNHIGENEKTPAFLIFTAEYDMPCRFEQNKLLIRTMEIFGYDKITFHLMNIFGHCGYIGAEDNDGNDIFFEKINDFIHLNI